MKRTKAEKLRGAAVSEKILNLEAELIKVRAEIGRSEEVCAVLPDLPAIRPVIVVTFDSVSKVSLFQSISLCTQERNELKKESDMLRDRARDLRADVDQETVTFLNAKSLAHALKEELEFFKSTTDQVLQIEEKRPHPQTSTIEHWVLSSCS